jgi:high-affinity Fe2+/Pb2+ permease
MRLKSLFAKAVSLGDGLGGAAIAHIGCVAAPIVASALGVGLSANFMAAAMFVGAPAIAVGLTYGLARLHGCSASPKKLAISAGFALVVSAGLHFSGLGHDHNAHSHTGYVHGHNSDVFYIDLDSICGTPPKPL